mmetsp:Transcript_33958/g.88525  ORF Transcript_33958/g.88525 Transcript_33958/m.88525 type:complete len:306 (-) Transcript_33958:357-1274(-)
MPDERLPLVRKEPKEKAAVGWLSRPFLACVLVPIALFLLIFWLKSFWVFHLYPMVVDAVVLLATLVPFFAAVAVYRRSRKKRSMRWACLGGVLSAAAIFGAWMAGDANYWRHCKNYYEYQDLAVYVNVNPDTDKGQSFMDAGEMYFSAGARVDRSRAVAFKNGDLYCAAPIVTKEVDSPPPGQDSKPPISGSQDFWAVGTNCCQPTGSNFVCPDTTSRLARSGLRLIRDDVRPFYQMAAAQWESKFGIPVKHPLFFSWIQDPKEIISGFWVAATRFFQVGCIAFCFINTMAAVLTKAVLFDVILA